jgi:hypothetical protein
MRNPFSRVFSRLTVDVCPNCEGGSGAFFNSDTGELTKCLSCAGTGRADNVQAAPVVDLALARAARSKEQRRVA